MGQHGSIVGTFTISAIIGVMILLPVITVWGQRGDVGKSPREVLSPQTIHQLTNLPDPIPQSMERQIEYIAARQQTVIEQLDALSSLAKEIAVNSQRVSALEDRMTSIEVRFSAHENAQIGEPKDIAVLKLQMDGIKATAGWFFGILATLISALLLIVIRKFRSGHIMTLEWAKKDAEVRSSEMHNYRKELSDKLNEVSTRAEAAYHEANQVNEKIAAAGIRVEDLIRERHDHGKEQ